MLISGRQQPPALSASSWSDHQVSWHGPTPCMSLLPLATRLRLYSRYFASVTSPAPAKIVCGSCPNTLWPPADSFSSIAHASFSGRPARFASATVVAGSTIPPARSRSVSEAAMTGSRISLWNGPALA
jgi:hypothetical protein